MRTLFFGSSKRVTRNPPHVDVGVVDADAKLPDRGLRACVGVEIGGGGIILAKDPRPKPGSGEGAAGDGYNADGDADTDVAGCSESALPCG